MSEYYGKGITVASGFDLGAKSPLDTRIVVRTIAERDAHVTGNRAYEGMIVYVIEDQTNYQYINSEWVKFKAGEVVDNLESTRTDVALSANQGRVLKEQIDNQGRVLKEQIDGQDAKIAQVDEKIADVDKRLDEVEIKIQEGVGGGTGNANIHVGTEPPKDTTYMWIDTSAPYNLDVSTYEGRMRLKYIEMLDNVIDKVNSLSGKIDTIEQNINKISSDNSAEMNKLKTQLASIRSKITSLTSRVNEAQYQLMNGGSLPTLKNTAKQLRKEMKQEVLYGLADLNYNVMVVLDSEIQFIQPDNPDNPSTGTDSSSLLTENGFMLLTEDGLVILIDGGTSSGGSSDILQGAILTEQGEVLLLENGKQLLKG